MRGRDEDTSGGILAFRTLTGKPLWITVLILVGILRASVRMGLRDANERGDLEMPMVMPSAGLPLPRNGGDPSDEATIPGSERVVSAIRAKGYRVSIHPLVGAVEMRAAPALEAGKTQSARAEYRGPDDTEAARLRCAHELAGKLGLELRMD